MTLKEFKVWLKTNHPQLTAKYRRLFATSSRPVVVLQAWPVLGEFEQVLKEVDGKIKEVTDVRLVRDTLL